MHDPSTNHPRAANWLRDLFASVVVFLVALPLCLGIAIASGMPAATGLITGIVGGLLVSALAGAPLQVSGPAAGLVVLTYEVIQQHGVESLGVVVLLCGVLQMAAGILRLGQWFRAVSPTVIHAMLTGIGILIVAGQIHVMVDDRPRENALQNLRTIPEAISKGLPWPKPSTPENNAELARYLQRFGALHEAQTEIETAVDAHVSRQGSTAEHLQQLEGLEALTKRQEALTHTWTATVDEFFESRAVLAKPEQSRSAIQSATARIRQARWDLDQRRADDVRASQAAAVAGIQNVLAQLKSHDWAAKIGLLSILVIVAWNALPFRLSQKIPSSLLAVAVATLACAVLRLPVLYVEIPEHLADAIVWPSLAAFRDTPMIELAKPACMMAIIASAETLLCATAVDRMHSGARTRYDRELFAQGVGNLACGTLGALPLTGVIVRSAANVQAGARSRWSAFLHGAWLLLFVLFLGDLLRMIPTACLAGILVYTGYRLIGWKTLWQLCREDKSEAAIFLVTVGLIVGQDLLTGVATGFVLSAIKLLMIFSHLKIDVRTDEPAGQARLALSGAATFLRLPLLATRLEQIPPELEVHVDLTRLHYIDAACLELLMQWAEERAADGHPCYMEGGKFHARLAGNGQPNGGVAQRQLSTRD